MVMESGHSSDPGLILVFGLLLGGRPGASRRRFKMRSLNQGSRSIAIFCFWLSFVFTSRKAFEIAVA